MKLSRHILIRPFTEADLRLIAELLQTATPTYLRFFHPFEFGEETLARLALKTELDLWFTISIEARRGAEIAGFYMLRGLDEGFEDPMYGIFIAENFAGNGLARLALAHAEAQCRLNGWRKLMLKMDPENTRACQLYESAGFEFLRIDPRNGNQVLVKTILD